MPSAGPPPEGSTPAAADDDALLDAARRGDDGAFAVLVERADPEARALAHDMLDGVGTDEALLDAYVKAYRALARSPRQARGWLVTMAFASAQAEARRRDRQRRGGPGRKPRPVPGGDGPLAAMRPEERAALSLVDRTGWSPSQAAAALHTTPAAVDALLDAARPAADATWPDTVGRAGQGFWAELGRRLLDARAAPAAGPPPMAPPEAPKAPPVAMQRRAPVEARIARGEPDAVDQLATGARQRRTPRRWLRTTLVAAAAVALLGAAGAGIAALVRTASEATSPVREGSVAQRARQASDALARDTFTALVERTSWTDGTPSTATYRIVRTAEGSFLLTGVDLERQVGYDAGTGVRTERTVVPTADGARVDAKVETGLAAGPPDPSAGDVALPDAELGLALRTLLEVDDVEAEAGTVDGTDVWRLEAPLPGPVADGQPDRVELVVDRARLGPVSLLFTDDGRPVRRLDFSQVAFDVPAPGPFAADLGGQDVAPVDHGFRTVSIDAVTDSVGRAPRRPTWLPDGFELDRVTVDPADGVVSIRYARGAEGVTVTTRPAPVAAGQPWPDPFGDDRPAPSTVELQAGPYRTVPASLLAVVGAVPSLWGTDGTTAFTVSGDLRADELVRVAESLR